MSSSPFRNGIFLPMCDRSTMCTLPMVVMMMMSLLLMCLMVVSGVSGGRRVDRNTKYGRVRGFVDSVAGHKVEKFLGVPYAKPPVGRLRFEAPEASDPWKGVLRTEELPPACPQPQIGIDYIKIHVPDFNRTSEDCLYVNIYLPKRYHHHKRGTTTVTKRRYHQHHYDYASSSSTTTTTNNNNNNNNATNSKMAVLVFIHGGSYQNGMGAMMDGSHLATQDLVVVTFNYRLGPLGFLEAGDDAFPGNYGLRDQILALQWVQENIHYFGGDPARVTIDGHSAGGCSAGLLMLMPMAKGLFHRVIQQSGSPFAHWAVTRRPTIPNFYFKLFTSAFSCYGNSTAEVKACLQTLPEEYVQKIILEQPEHPTSLVPPFRPVVDGIVLPDSPERLAASGEINGHEILTGTTTDEGLIAAVPLLENYGTGLHGLRRLLAVLSCFRGDLPETNSILESVLEQYFRWPFDEDDETIKGGFVEIVGDYFIAAPTQSSVDRLAARNVTVFLYNYDYGSRFDMWDGVIHGAELFYLSGYPMSEHSKFRYDDRDKSMASTLIQLWASFIKNGLPSMVPIKDFHMPPYSPTSPVYTKMSTRNGLVAITVEINFKPDKMAFWNHRVPQLYLKQLARDQNLLTDTSVIPPNFRNAVSEIYYNSYGDGNTIDRKQYKINAYPSSRSWVLIAVCIGLSALTVLLSVCYCQVKRQVNALVKQRTIRNGQAML